MTSDNAIDISFHLPFQTNYGENLYVVGNIPSFGQWDPRRGRRMMYKHPSTWFLQTKLEQDLKAQVLKYKYCIMNDNEENGGVPRWEPGEEHKAELTRAKVECKDVWGLGKKVRNVPLPGVPGKLYSSPMPFSSFDPFQTAYRELSTENIDVLVLLCYQSEVVKQTGGQDLIKRYGRDGFAIIWYPVDDFSVPLDISSFSNMLSRVHTLLKKGCNIAVQCHAGIGRTGLTIACLAKKFFGKEDSEVIAWVREYIIGAVQSKEQIDYVASFNTNAGQTLLGTNI